MKKSQFTERQMHTLTYENVYRVTSIPKPRGAIDRFYLVRDDACERGQLVCGS